MRTIYVTSGGAEYLTARITSDHDISADVVKLALSPVGVVIDDAAPAWQSPDLKVMDGSDVLAKMLVNAAVTPGLYWFWRRVTDTPEVPAAPVADLMGRPVVVQVA